MKLRPIALSLLAGLSFSVTSCIQSESDNVLNPDGSGKFTIKATLDLGPLAGMLGGQDGKADLGDPGKDMILSILSGTKGVDVWKDAKSTKGADGKLSMVVSGYFKDITKFKAGNPMESLGGAAGGGGGKSSGPGFGEVKTSKDADGNWIVELPLSDDKKAAEPAEKPEPKEKLSKEEVADKVKEMRDQFAAMKPMMASMLGNMKITQTIKVGGEIKDYGLFTKIDANSAKLEISFAKMFDGIEKLMADDKIAGQMASLGGSNPMELIGSADPEAKEVAAQIMQTMFGGKGEPKLVIKASGPAFDYAKEAEAAKAAQSAELKALLKEAAEKAGSSDEEKEAAPAAKKKAA